MEGWITPSQFQQEIRDLQEKLERQADSIRQYQEIVAEYEGLTKREKERRACSYCSKNIVIRQDGGLWAHYAGNGKLCKGVWT